MLHLVLNEAPKPPPREVKKGFNRSLYSDTKEGPSNVESPNVHTPENETIAGSKKKDNRSNEEPSRINTKTVKNRSKSVSEIYFSKDNEFIDNDYYYSRKVNQKVAEEQGTLRKLPYLQDNFGDKERDKKLRDNNTEKDSFYEKKAKVIRGGRRYVLDKTNFAEPDSFERWKYLNKTSQDDVETLKNYIEATKQPPPVKPIVVNHPERRETNENPEYAKIFDDPIKTDEYGTIFDRSRYNNNINQKGYILDIKTSEGHTSDLKSGGVKQIITDSRFSQRSAQLEATDILYYTSLSRRIAEARVYESANLWNSTARSALLKYVRMNKGTYMKQGILQDETEQKNMIYRSGIEREMRFLGLKFSEDIMGKGLNTEGQMGYLRYYTSARKALEANGATNIARTSNIYNKNNPTSILNLQSAFSELFVFNKQDPYIRRLLFQTYDSSEKSRDLMSSELFNILPKTYTGTIYDAMIEFNQTNASSLSLIPFYVSTLRCPSLQSLVSDISAIYGIPIKYFTPITTNAYVMLTKNDSITKAEKARKITTKFAAATTQNTRDDILDDAVKKILNENKEQANNLKFSSIMAASDLAMFQVQIIDEKIKKNHQETKNKISSVLAYERKKNLKGQMVSDHSHSKSNKKPKHNSQKGRHKHKIAEDKSLEKEGEIKRFPHNFSVDPKNKNEVVNESQQKDRQKQGYKKTKNKRVHFSFANDQNLGQDEESYLDGEVEAEANENGEYIIKCKASHKVNPNNSTESSDSFGDDEIERKVEDAQLNIYNFQ